VELASGPEERLVRHPGLRATIHILPPLDGSPLSRRHIAEYCRHAIAEALEMETSPATALHADPQARVSLDPSPRSLAEAA
jgi:hypothetical protein